MQNSQENAEQNLPILSNNHENKFYEILYSINKKGSTRNEIHCILRAINFIIVFIIFSTLEDIYLLPRFVEISNIVVPICIYSSIGLILIELLLGAIYGKQMEIKIQFLVYRQILFTISFYLLVNAQVDSLSQTLKFIIYAVVICILVVILWVTWVIGSQSFINNLVIDSGVPYSLLFLFFQTFLCIYSTNSEQLKDLSLLFLTLTAIFSKFWWLDQNIRRSKCLEYTLIRIQINTNLLYAVLLIIERVKLISKQQKEPSIFIFPLILFICFSQFLFQYYDHMRPINEEFFNSTLNTPQFLQACQFILNDIDKVQNIKKEDIVKTSLLPIYYLHSKYCHQPHCPLSHELQPQTLSNYKALSSIILRIIQELYLKHLEVQYENISLRIGLISLFTRSSSNKVKALQLLTETQMMSLSWWDRMKFYFLKKSLSDKDFGQFSQNRKMEDSYQSFHHSISSLMKHLSQFWTQFIDERIDFQKILVLTGKITPLMKSIQDEVQKAIQAETFSTIHTMKMYSDYNRSILNDQMKSAMINDYVNLLSKKMSKVNQINYISADLQIGLIAISLNVKKLGQIKIANAQAASIFNYSKQQFMKINVNSIMPESFARYHDDFLKVFLVHENKKVNTDRRLLVGRKRENFIFQIFLQLQKSVITVSEQLIFIANIELAKMYQSNFLIICDDKGVISDRNSTFYELFQKSSRKKKSDPIKKYINIQQLIPNFFQIALSEKSSKETIECFDNPLFGIIQIKFQIIKVQLPQVPDFGFIIKGKRLYDSKQPFFKNIFLTNALLESSEQRQLKGMKLQYSSNQHQYQFSQSLQQFNCGQYFSEFTIPYVKLEFFGSVLNQKLVIAKQYDSEIKTLRYYGDHFQRVEELDSFSSEITDEQKFSANKNNILSMKTDLQGKQKTLTKKFPHILTFIIILIQIILVSAFYFFTAAQNNQILEGINIFSEAYSYRSKISQYIIYFQAQGDPLMGSFFKEKKEILKQQLINDVTKANLPQLQKQRAQKLIYLQSTLQNQKFVDIVNDDTLLLKTIVEKPATRQTSTILKSVIGVFILLKICIGFIVTYWHKQKIVKILSMFLVLPEATIKKSHKNCMQFLRNASDTMEAGKLKDEEEQQQSENEQNQVKIKRFKNTAFEKSYIKFFKINTFTGVFLLIFVSMVVTEKIIWSNLKKDKQIHDFISTVMPQYSTNLMKIYSEIGQKTLLSISQQFTSKYQNFDQKIASLSDDGFSSESEKFYKILYDSQCENTKFDLPKGVKCEQIYDAVMLDGISEAVNLVAHELKKIQRYYNETSIESLNNITILLFHLIKPKIELMKEDVEKQLTLEKSNANLEQLIFYLSLVIVSVVDVIYLLNYSLRQIQESVESSRILINLISDQKKKQKEASKKYKKT